MPLKEVKCREYNIISGDHTWQYTGYRRLDENEEIVSAYIAPTFRAVGVCAVWVSSDKLEQVLNFIEVIGGYE